MTRTWQHVVAWAVAVAVLLGVFAMYLQPDFMVQLAQLVLACF